MSWTDVKKKLADFDRKGLLDLVHDLYGAHNDNQQFLHARFGLGEDVLEPYRKTISRWLSPDLMRHQDTSVTKAKQAITSYRKAVDDPAGVAELMVFFCERGAGFCAEYGNDDEVYFNALCLVFGQALGILLTLPVEQRDAFFARLEEVRNTSHKFGYGVGDSMDDMLVNFEDALGLP